MADSPHRHLPRLSDENYRGFQFVHWIMTISGRRQGWLKDQFHLSLRLALTHAAYCYHVVIPVYCLMPDHIHLLAVGTVITSDQKLWARAVRRSINLALKPLKLQRQGYDHVLRPEEKGADAFSTLIHYICENPMRAGIVTHSRDWPYTGAIVPDMPDLDPSDTDFYHDWWSYWNDIEVNGPNIHPAGSYSATSIPRSRLRM